MQKITALILAAGEGKRMKSKNSKVLHKILGKPMIEYVYDKVKEAGISNCACVVGHRAEQVQEYMKDRFVYFLQSEQLGTGHAVMQARDYLAEKSEYVFVLCGDTPLIRKETIEKTIRTHIENDYAATIISSKVNDPTGYGRIVRDHEQNVIKIVEHKDADEEELMIKEINSGMYCFTTKYLLAALNNIKNDNVQGEYYLTDTIELILRNKLKVGAVKVEDIEEVYGINDRLQLQYSANILKNRINDEHMRNGVTIVDSKATYIGPDVEIGMDTVINPGCIIEGNSIIGENCCIGPNSNIYNSKIGDHTKINSSELHDSCVGDSTAIGPFAYIRPKSQIGSDVKIGDFVEIKASIIGNRTKISHLTYIGDAEVGENVNIGCGVVVVNYNGKAKSKTIIGNNAFVGCNTNLVSPVEVKNDAYIAAGSTITEDVPSYSLAIARERQVNKEEWVIKKGMKRS